VAQQTHAQIIDALAAINRTVPGINIAYGSTNLPQTLVQFPAAMVLLGPDDYGKFGPTEYWIRVFVASVTTGNVSAAYSQCLSLSGAFHDAYTHLQTVGDRLVYRQNLALKMGFGNTGFAYTLKWGSGEFYGFQINVPLMSSVPGA
jgi:hypothetical protein